MYFHNRHFDCRDGVGNGIGVVRIGPGVEHYAGTGGVETVAVQGIDALRG